MSRRGKLSVCLATYNEEDYLGDCLESVRWADEVVIVDGQSTDGTVELARRYGARVLIRPNAPNPNVNKNLAFDEASGDWILCLDADERVEERLREEIEAILRQDGPCDGYWIPRKNYFLGRWLRHGGEYPDWQLRLFRRGKGRFPGRTIHEFLEVKGSTGRLQGHLLHVGNFRGFAHYVDKANRYTDVDARALAREGYRPGFKGLVIRPALIFLRKYILWGGFLDGWMGFALAVLAAYYAFLRDVKVYELRRCASP